jgi:hypothetical protein
MERAPTTGLGQPFALEELLARVWGYVLRER